MNSAMKKIREIGRFGVKGKGKILIHECVNEQDRCRYFKFQPFFSRLLPSSSLGIVLDEQTVMDMIRSIRASL
jgi:hypothetical protein